jgi:hypothetical protein
MSNKINQSGVVENMCASYISRQKKYFMSLNITIFLK